MKEKKVLILGAGLAGLSCAYHLQSKKNLKVDVIEKSDHVGGTARSIEVGGFTFDFTGHLLHLHHPYTKNLIQKLLKGNLVSCVRKAAIYSHGVLTPYPFQVNTYGLPSQVKKECVEGFKEAVQKYGDDSLRSTSLSFDKWSLRTFGKGVHKHFMKPYNEKLWQVSLDKMTAEWCGMFVPQPKLEDVIAGSQKNLEKSFGYNVTFLYPKKGGIQVLPQALAKESSVQTNTSFEEVDWKKKNVLLSNGKRMDYDALISSVPLVELLRRLKDLPKDVKEAMSALKWTSILCINMGVSRPNISDKSWIYFPEKKFSFYRVGFPMNFTPHAVPKGCSSMYIEVANPPEETLDYNNPNFLNRIRKDLEKCEILSVSDKIIITNFIPIRYAYVLYTPNRSKILSTIFSFLKENNISSIGRYGGWKYSFMEEAILDGKKTAESILTNL